jgi:hypothetical protein
MLTRPQIQRYAAESGLRDVMIAEKEVVLTYLLQLLSERRILSRLAFKGGTCLRKMYFGSQGRFSTDLDFTGLEVGGDFDWNDLGQLLRRTVTVDRDRITADCARGFRFLLDLTEDERTLAADSHHRERDLWERLSEGARNEALLRVHR